MEIIKKRIGQYKESCFNSHVSEEIIEIIVPDIQPDFENVISSFATCKITEKSALSGSIKITGKLFASIHYSSTASECAYTINATSDFAKSIKYENSNPIDVFTSNSKVLSTAVEIINSRKIRLKILLCTVYTTFNLENIDLIEDICSEVGENIQSLTSLKAIRPCVDISDKGISFTEDIRLTDSEYANLFRIVSWKTEWFVDETKIMQNRILIRGHISIDISSTNENSFEIMHKSYVLPFSQVMDCKNTYEDDEIIVYLSQDNCNINLIQKEDNFYLCCDCSATATSFTYREMNIKHLSDAYSTVFESDIKTSKLQFSEKTSIWSSNNNIEAKIETLNAIENVMNYSIITSHQLVNKELQVHFYINTICSDVMGTICSLSGHVESNIPLNTEILSNSITLHINDIKANIDSAGILFSFNVSINSLSQINTEINSVTVCSIDKSKKRSRITQGNLILRKVLPGESIWSISKNYGTTCDAIISANNLEDNSELPLGKLIIVPFVKQ